MVRTPRPTARASSRRAFLAGAAATGGALVVGADLAVPRALAAGSDAAPRPGAFVRIAPDDIVTVIVKHLDKGQGIATGLATIVADELGADWARVRTAFAPANAALYNNLSMGPIQGTGGSTSVANSWDQLRRAAAAAREMLAAAAALDWRVPAAEITVANGIVAHPPSGRSARFGALASAAAALPVPASPRLKAPSERTLIGTRVPRLDSAMKTEGRAVYSLDVRRPGALTALVAHPPTFGGRVKAFDDARARAVPGVVDVVAIPSGVAVLARDTWSAMKGRDALDLTWDGSLAESRSSDALMAGYRAAARRRGLVAARRGDAGRALAGAVRVVEAEFAFPYLAHAAMEPLNATIEPAADGGYDVYAGCQFPTIEQAVVAGILGLTTDRVRMHTQWAGGSFGRRATPEADYLAEAAHIVRATGARAPVHLVWTREDDMAGGHYRPMAYHRVRAGLDADGRVAGWDHAIVAKPILIGTPLEATIVLDGVDPSSVEGAADTDYAIPNLRVEVHNAKEGVPVLWFRSVGHTHTAQVMEVVMDELAHLAGADPVAFRLAHLASAPRLAGVLRLAAERAGWRAEPPRFDGRGRGVAAHTAFETHVAMVADVAVEDGRVRVERIVAAVDCGVAVNPDVIVAQVEGAVGFALSSVLRNRITLRDGVVQERNFDTYAPTRIGEMPRVEVHIVPSNEDPTGIGEPGVPPVAPAITNAVFAATGRRLRSLPLDLDALRGA